MTIGLAKHPFLSYAFRPMFLGLGLFAVMTLALWLLTLAGAAPASDTRGPLWHGHEMLFGFALAAVAGFLLTAVATWTGRPPIQGVPLVCLVTAWLIGRIVMASGLTASVWTAGIAMAFPMLLTVFVAREILLGGSQRNYPIALIVAVLALLDALYHFGALGIIPNAERFALLATLYLFVVLISIIAGRIIPSFTGNWLRSRGATRLPASMPWVERVVLPATGLTGVLALALPDHRLTGLAAAGSAVLHTLRLYRWRGLSTVSEPLVFILHVGYAWLPAGFTLLSASILGGTIPATSATHAFGVGAIGVMIFAVTTRVALGHTGRPLRASLVIVIAYIVLNVAAVVRVAAPATGGDYLAVLEVGGLSWIVAWLLFLLIYVPILVRPRVDS